MSTRLRILIEMDGVAWLDTDIIVGDVRLNKRRHLREKPATASSSPSKEWEPTGDHTITIDYRDVFA